MSVYDELSPAPPGEYLLLEYDQGATHFDAAFFPTMSEYEELGLEYTDMPQTAVDLSLQPELAGGLYTPNLSPLDTPQTSPSTLYEETQWLPGGEVGDVSPEIFFSFESPTLTSPVDTPASSTLSPGDQIPQTPTSLEPSSPPPPAPEPVQNPDGTWACPQAGCTHPGHKRRCDARKHHKSHTKPYACKMRNCDYRSSNAKDRERHYDTRHASTKHPTCPNCGVHKSRVDNMRDHIRRKHPGMDYRSPRIQALYPRRRGRS